MSKNNNINPRVSMSNAPPGIYVHLHSDVVFLLSLQSALAPSSAVVAMEYGLASLQLMDMRFTASTFSNNDVDVQATMADILLADEQKHRQQKKTG